MKEKSFTISGKGSDAITKENFDRTKKQAIDLINESKSFVVMAEVSDGTAILSAITTPLHLMPLLEGIKTWKSKMDALVIAQLGNIRKRMTDEKQSL